MACNRILKRELTEAFKTSHKALASKVKPSVMYNEHDGHYCVNGPWLVDPAQPMDNITPLYCIGGVYLNYCERYDASLKTAEFRIFKHSLVSQQATLREDWRAVVRETCLVLNWRYSEEETAEMAEMEREALQGRKGRKEREEHRGDGSARSERMGAVGLTGPRGPQGQGERESWEIEVFQASLGLLDLQWCVDRHM